MSVPAEVRRDNTQLLTASVLLPIRPKRQKIITDAMMLMWMCTGVVITVGSAGTASAQTQDPLECSPEEYFEAQRAIPPSMNTLYKPLLTEDFSELRLSLTNENSVRWHVNCILYDKACTKLSKAMQCEYSLCTMFAG